MAVATLRIRPTRKHRNFEALRKNIKSNGHQVAYNYARSVVKTAKIYVPKRTWYLHSQIKWERIRPGHFSIYVDGDTTTRTGAYYGVYVEYGTRHMAAQPYFRPAIETHKADYRHDLKAIFK